MSSLKETDFFIREKNYDRGLRWYSSLFATNECLRGEASPNYSKRHLFPDVAERIHRHLPSAKLIYLVRDPIERIISHYVHNYAHGRERRSLERAVGAGEGCNYLDTSRYYFQLTAYLEYFDHSNICVIASEDLAVDPVATTTHVLDFLGVEPWPDASVVLQKKFHESAEKRRRPWVDRHVPNATAARMLKAVLPPTLTEPTEFERPKLRDDARLRLVERLQADVDALRRLTGLPFESWKI